jgi:hypothetical protein
MEPILYLNAWLQNSPEQLKLEQFFLIYPNSPYVFGQQLLILGEAQVTLVIRTLTIRVFAFPLFYFSIL